MSKKRYKSNVPLEPVIEPKIGIKYHVSWGYSKGVVGKCIEVDSENKTVILITPKTKQRFKNPVNWSDLLHIRKNQTRDYEI